MIIITKTTLLKKCLINLSIFIFLMVIFLGTICGIIKYCDYTSTIKLKNIPLLQDDISNLKFYTYDFGLCYAENSIEINYINDVINGKYETPRFLSIYDQNKIFSFKKVCDEKLKNIELAKLKSMKNDELINLQKKSLNNL